MTSPTDQWPKVAVLWSTVVSWRLTPTVFLLAFTYRMRHFTCQYTKEANNKRCIREELGRKISHTMCTNVCQYVPMCSNMYQWVPISANVNWCVPICANVCRCVPSLIANCTICINRWFNLMATLHLKVFPMEKPSCHFFKTKQSNSVYIRNKSFELKQKEFRAQKKKSTLQCILTWLYFDELKSSIRFWRKSYSIKIIRNLADYLICDSSCFSFSCTVYH